jgi:hypothetical protein
MCRTPQVEFNNNEIGMLGERVVQGVFGGERSINMYDTEKDLLLPNGDKAEVKTQIRNRYKNSFTVPADTVTGNQLHKCLTVKRLFFVEYGTSGHIRIYECVDRSFTIDKNNAGELACFPVDKMVLHFDKYLPKLCKKMNDLSEIQEYFRDDSWMYES